ncbi:MAG: hypothetical protein IT355_18515 [Gemmatimonadaceae bacterium]|nr:hypothetical protein [Gemmatimonadaceae bacterium]
MTPPPRLDPEAGGFPRGISQPALRALAGVNVTQVEQLATWTEAEIALLHGMGPKGVRILRDALALRGLSFRT